MLRLLRLLVEIAQIALQCIGIAPDFHPAVDHLVIVTLQVALDILIAHHRHVAVDKQQVVISGRLCQEVTDGGTPHILLPHDILASGQRGYLQVSLHRGLIRRTVIGHDDLIVYARPLQLGVQLLHQLQTRLIISRYEDRNTSHLRDFSAKIM